MSRTLSYSEVSIALDCWAKHAFQYTGHLTAGEVLKPKSQAPRLSEGSAWGAGVAAFHMAADQHPTRAIADGRIAILNSLARDNLRMAEWGYDDPAARECLENKVIDCLDHYAHLSSLDDRLAPIKVTRLEETLIVPILSRSGRRKSSRYRFMAKIDGWHIDDAGRYGPVGGHWLVEYKNRDQLQPMWLMERNRQYRWYAWAYEQTTGQRPLGILIDERVAEAPKPPRTVKAKRKGEGIDGRTVSHAKDQLCTPEDYIALCEEFGVEPESEPLEAMRARRWQQRVPLQFRPSEIEEGGRELVTAAHFIGQLDAGTYEPLRNAKRATCQSCRFKEICPTPGDTPLVNSLFERRPPKRSLPPKEGH